MNKDTVIMADVAVVLILFKANVYLIT